MRLAATIIGPVVTFGVGWAVRYVHTPDAITSGELQAVFVVGSVSMIALLTAGWIHAGSRAALLISQEEGRDTESDSALCGSSCVRGAPDVITFGGSMGNDLWA